MDELTVIFEEQRTHLRAVGYRLLGRCTRPTTPSRRSLAASLGIVAFSLPLLKRMSA